MLGNLYNSIVKNLELNDEVRQSIQVQWLIIDDGSTDNTEEIINQYINEKKIEIQYHNKKIKEK